MTATGKRRIVRKSNEEKSSSRPQVRARSRGWNAEQALISTMLIDKSYHEVVEAGVTDEWFHSFKEEWKFVHRYISKHKATPSRRILERKFPEFKVLPAEDIHYLIDEVRQVHTRHALLMLTGEITEAIRDKQDPTEVLKVVERRVMTVTGQVDGSNGQQSDLVADWQEGYAEVSARVERANDTGMSGITTGFPTLDAITGGVDEGHYWVVGARLGAGKTWMAAQMACAALMAGEDVIYFSLEMLCRQMEMRMHNLLSSTFGEEVFRSIDLMQGRGFDLLRYKKYLRRLPQELEGHLIIDDSSGKRVTPTTIAAQIERHRPRLVFVDYLTLMSPSNDWQAVSDTSAALKTLCSQYDGISIVAAAQINRAGAGKRPPSADEIAGSDGIGRDVDAIVTMASQSQRVKRMHLAKYRHGPDKQMWYASLDLRAGTFSEISGSKAQDLIDEDEEAAELSKDDDE